MESSILSCVQCFAKLLGLRSLPVIRVMHGSWHCCNSNPNTTRQKRYNTGKNASFQAYIHKSVTNSWQKHWLLASCAEVKSCEWWQFYSWRTSFVPMCRLSSAGSSRTWKRNGMWIRNSQKPCCAPVVIISMSQRHSVRPRTPQTRLYVQYK